MYMLENHFFLDLWEFLLDVCCERGKVEVNRNQEPLSLVNRFRSPANSGDVIMIMIMMSLCTFVQWHHYHDHFTEFTSTLACSPFGVSSLSATTSLVIFSLLCSTTPFSFKFPQNWTKSLPICFRICRNRVQSLDWTAVKTCELPVGRILSSEADAIPMPWFLKPSSLAKANRA